MDSFYLWRKLSNKQIFSQHVINFQGEYKNIGTRLYSNKTRIMIAERTPLYNFLGINPTLGEIK
jgi:hypothetical protein